MYAIFISVERVITGEQSVNYSQSRDKPMAD